MAQAPHGEIGTGEAAAILGVSTQTILTYVDKGYLACRYLPSGTRRFQRADVEALLEPTPRAAAQ